jgi:hypothetical protein
MKLFRTNNISVIDECRLMFGMKLPSTLIASRITRFISQIQFVNNSLLNLFRKKIV